MSERSDELASALRELEGFPDRWFVSGGWAIDLFLGEETREHEDIEIGTFRSDQLSLQTYFAGRELYEALPGRLVPWDDGEWLSLPVHQVVVPPRGGGPIDEQWEPTPGTIQFFLNDVDGDDWVCRRNPRVKRPVSEITTSSASGTPIVVPELQLLYKAKHHKEKDEHDFREALGALSAEQRSWLRDALEIVHPGDPWLDAL
jgi:hypothetical protein